MRGTFVFDFDATIAAEQGRFRSSGVRTLLRELDAAGWSNVMLTGRPIGYAVGPRGMADPDDLHLLTAVVGGYGTTVWYPRRNRMRLLTPPISPLLQSEFRRHGIPASVIFGDAGSLLVRRPHAAMAAAAVTELDDRRRQHGLPALGPALTVSAHSTVFQGAPTNKLQAFEAVVLGELRAGSGIVVGAGDSWESDGPFLSRCDYAVVPANADPRLKALPNAVVCSRPGAAGVVEGMRRVRSMLATVPVPDATSTDVSL